MKEIIDLSNLTNLCKKKSSYNALIGNFSYVLPILMEKYVNEGAVRDLKDSELHEASKVELFFLNIFFFAIRAISQNMGSHSIGFTHATYLSFR